MTYLILAIVCLLIGYKIGSSVERARIAIAFAPLIGEKDQTTSQ